MATERIIPMRDGATNQNISINTSFAATPRACIILSTQAITFTNGSGSPVSIQFVPNPINPSQPIFNNISNLPGGPSPSQPQTPNNLNNGNGSVNYYIVAGGVPYGPYAIQIGNGPLQVLISMSGGNITCTPNPSVIPTYNSALGIAGTIEMVPDNVINNYAIGWPGGDPFTPPLTSPDSQPHADGPGTTITDYDFTVSTRSPREGVGGGGGGTVKIKGAN